MSLFTGVPEPSASPGHQGSWMTWPFCFATGGFTKKAINLLGVLQRLITQAHGLIAKPGGFVLDPS